MTSKTNRQWILKARPQGMVDTSSFELQEAPIEPLREGQVRAQTMYLSFDPTQRSWMAMDTYMPMVPLGEPMRAGGIAQVIESKHPKYKPGDIVTYYMPNGWLSKTHIAIVAAEKKGEPKPREAILQAAWKKTFGDWKDDDWDRLTTAWLSEAR